MSIRLASGGILETTVTWAETEQAIQKALCTRASFGPAKSATHIGDGNGFLSKVAVINPDWQGQEKERDSLLPSPFVLKMASCLKAASMEKKQAETGSEHFDPFDEQKWAVFEGFIKKLHNYEAAFYEFSRPWASDILIPHNFYTTRFSETNPAAGAIAMEHLKGSIKHLHHTMSNQNAKQIARQLGKIQALALRHKIVEKVPEIAKRDAHAEFWSNFNLPMAEGMLQLLKQFKEGDQRMQKAVDAAVNILPEYFGGNLASTLHIQLGITPVIVNGDLWSGNVIFDEETDEIVSLIDWQLVHVGCGVEDLIRITLAGLSAEDRRASVDELLEEMHRGLVENLNGEKLPFTLQELKDTYELLFPHCVMFFVPVIANVSQVNAPGISDEEKAKRMAIVSDKALGLLEDLLVYHERNLENDRKLCWKTAGAA